jgi:hypothetical protein
MHDLLFLLWCRLVMEHINLFTIDNLLNLPKVCKNQYAGVIKLNVVGIFSGLI